MFLFFGGLKYNLYMIVLYFYDYDVYKNDNDSYDYLILL